MSYKSFQTAMLAGCISVLATISFAADQDQTDIDAYYQEGVIAFKAQNYDEALGHFNQALDAGDNSAQLRYNIAVSYYQLGQLEDAKAEFAGLAEDAQLGWWSQYNMALISEQQNATQSAKQGYLLVAQNSQDAGLVRLATSKAQDLGGVIAEQTPAKSDLGWIGSVGVGLGYDDNVIDPEDTAGTETGDHYYETLLTASNSWGDPQAVTWRLDGIGYASRYGDVDQYDVNLANVGISAGVRFADWQLRAGVEGEYSTVGDDGFLQNLALKLSGRYALPERKAIKLIYEITDYNSLSDQYDQLAGNGHRVDAEYHWYSSERVRWQLRYRLGVEDRVDLEDIDSFSSYSPIRNGLRLRCIWRPGDWEYVMTLGYRDSQFQDDNRIGGRSIQRHDKRIRAAISTLYQWSNNWSASIEMSYSDNDSSIEDFSYDRTGIVGGISWTF